MTLVEQTKIIKQANKLIASVIDDMIRNGNDPETFKLLQKAHTNSRATYFRLKRELWKQPLGIKEEP